MVDGESASILAARGIEPSQWAMVASINSRSTSASGVPISSSTGLRTPGPAGCGGTGNDATRSPTAAGAPSAISAGSIPASPLPASRLPASLLHIFLVGTQHPGNIGAAARAMKTMGLSRLVLVAPEKAPDRDTQAMAAGARERFGTDLAVSTTGYAGPSAGPGQPVGLVYVAVASARGVQSWSFNWFGTRTEIQSRTAKFALNRVRLHCLGM